jgi:hypothetical protein
MVSRFDLYAVPRWQYGEEFLTLLDSLEGASLSPVPPIFQTNIWPERPSSFPRA